MIRKISVAVFALWIGASAACYAQAAPDPIRDALPPPDVVMAHQDALGLSDTQKKAIMADVMAAQQRFIPAQQKLEDATKALLDIVRQTRVDAAKAQAQLDTVLACEREIKHLQLGLMVQVKNELTAQQQAIVRQYGPATTK
jgi:Spy/CpxP family protein refolding chaperone